MGLMKADGWNAAFQGTLKDGKTYTFTEKVAFWLERGGGLEGLCQDTYGFYDPASKSNFKGYVKDDDAIEHYVAAASGWWVVSTTAPETEGGPSGWWWSRVVLWGVGGEGFTLRAIGTPDGDGCTSADEPSDKTFFVYDPARLAEGDGPDPSTLRGVAS